MGPTAEGISWIDPNRDRGLGVARRTRHAHGSSSRWPRPCSSGRSRPSCGTRRHHRSAGRAMRWNRTIKRGTRAATSLSPAWTAISIPVSSPTASTSSSRSRRSGATSPRRLSFPDSRSRCRTAGAYDVIRPSRPSRDPSSTMSCMPSRGGASCAMRPPATPSLSTPCALRASWRQGRHRLQSRARSAVAHCLQDTPPWTASDVTTWPGHRVRPVIAQPTSLAANARLVTGPQQLGRSSTRAASTTTGRSPAPSATRTGTGHTSVRATEPTRRRATEI